MDIAKPKPRSQLRANKLVVIPLVLAALMLCGWNVIHPSDAHELSRSSILLGKVKQGDLDVSIEGYGVLRSERQKLLTTSTGGSVEEIYLKPGAIVTPDSTIMQLRNPDIEHKVAEEQQKLEREKMSLRQLELSQQVDMLGERAKLDEEHTKFKAAKLTLEEQLPWAEKGVITKLTFRETELKAALLAKSVEAFESRIRQLQLVHKEILQIQREKIAAQASTYQAAKNQFDQLKVNAGMPGVVQSVPVEIGQNVPASQQLALIGGTDKLLALVKVPQSAAARLKPGQATVVDTHQDKMNGHITRIDPAVKDGTVQVEIAFKDSLPLSARPELNVDATIIADHLKNVLYIERPVNIRPNSTANIFRLENNHAVPTPVVFGSEAGKFIQVSGRVNAGDTIILSDMSKYQKSSNVVIVDGTRP
jgi:HlyD family secretion protein